MASEFLINAVAGTLGGVAGIYVGSPLDVIKTRMQTGAMSAGLVSGVSRVLREHGVQGLFRGALVSSVGQAPNNFITFGAYGATLSLLTSYRNARPPSASAGSSGMASLPPLADVYLAGTSAGFLQTLALTPCELIKVQQQMFAAGPDGKPLSMLGCARLITSRYGLRGLYRGWLATCLRDAGTYGVYFSMYDLLRRRLGTFNPDTGDVDADAWALLLAGGVAGACSWLLALPADVVKSVIQAVPLDRASTHETGAPARTLSMRTAAAQIYAASGYGGFFRGLAPCILRALPVNAVTFFAYESSLEAINGSLGRDKREQRREALHAAGVRVDAAAAAAAGGSTSGSSAVESGVGVGSAVAAGLHHTRHTHTKHGPRE